MPPILPLKKVAQLTTELPNESPESIKFFDEFRDVGYQEGLVYLFSLPKVPEDLFSALGVVFKGIKYWIIQSALREQEPKDFRLNVFIGDKIWNDPAIYIYSKPEELYHWSKKFPGFSKQRFIRYSIFTKLNELKEIRFQDYSNLISIEELIPTLQNFVEHSKEDKDKCCGIFYFVNNDENIIKQIFKKSISNDEDFFQDFTLWLSYRSIKINLDDCITPENSTSILGWIARRSEFFSPEFIKKILFHKYKEIKSEYADTFVPLLEVKSLSLNDKKSLLQNQEAPLNSLIKMLGWKSISSPFAKDDFLYLIEEIKKRKDNYFPLIVRNLLEDDSAFFYSALNIIYEYCIAKGKNLRDVYMEVRQNPDILLGIRFGDLYQTELEKIIPTTKALIASATNFQQVIKDLDRIKSASDILHVLSNGDEDIVNLVSKFILNRQLDITQSWIEDIVESFRFIKSTEDLDSKIENANKILNRSVFDPIKIRKMISDYNSFIQKISTPGGLISSEEISLVKTLATEIYKISNIETVVQYSREAKPKDKKLFDLNLTLGPISFQVLQDLDPRMFSIGAETDCCQRIGGAGEEAAIDSFVNNLAGVLTVSVNGNLVAQSYFHYVPQDNGYILDNVEFNELNCKNLKWKISQEETCFELSKLIQTWAAKIKEKNSDIKYILCGKAYNKIDSSLFEEHKLEEDPRDFTVDDPYSDFDENNHINLLKPSQLLVSTDVPLPFIKPEGKQALFSSSETSLIKLALIRNQYLGKYT